MSTSTELDLDSLIDLDESPMCEWEKAETIHGESEVATGMSHLPCSDCGHVDHNLIGDACTTFMGRVHREIPNLTFACLKCGSQQLFLNASVTAI